MINLCVMKFSGTRVRKKEGRRSHRDPSQSRLFERLPSNKHWTLCASTNGYQYERKKKPRSERAGFWISYRGRLGHPTGVDGVAVVFVETGLARAVVVHGVDTLRAVLLDVDDTAAGPGGIFLIR